MDKNKIHIEMMTQNHLILDLYDHGQISNVSNWCQHNLKNSEWDMTAMRLFNNPWYRFHFKCSKKKFLALLNM